MTPELLAKIRAERERGELLGPLCDKYGAEAVVKALGVPHVACSLGVGPAPAPSGAETTRIVTLLS